MPQIASKTLQVMAGSAYTATTVPWWISMQSKARMQLKLQLKHNCRWPQASAAIVILPRTLNNSHRRGQLHAVDTRNLTYLVTPRLWSTLCQR